MKYLRGTILLMALLFIGIILCYDISMAQYETQETNTNDSIGVDTNGDDSPNAYLYPAFIKKGSNVTLSVANDTLTISGDAGSGTSDTCWLVNTAHDDSLAFVGAEIFLVPTTDGGVQITISNDTAFINATLGNQIDLASAEVTGVLPDGNVSDAITVTGYMQDTDINTFSDLQAWVSDKTLVNEEDVFTIEGNWVNTTNPWADNEVANDITIDLATLATTVTVTDDESTGDNHEIVFTTDNSNLESDGDVYYNPASGTIYSTAFSGDGALLTNVGAGSPSVVSMLCRNTTGSTLDPMKAVYISGATGGLGLIALADNTDAAKREVVGITMESINNNSNGLVLLAGEYQIGNTSAFSDGDPLYFSTAGTLTATQPTSGFIQHIATVTYDNASVGKIAMSIHIEPYIAASADENIDIRMGDDAGSYKVEFENYSDNDVATINSLGLISTLVGLDALGAVDMDYGSGDVLDHTFLTDGTGTAEIVLPAGSIDGTEILNGTINGEDLNSNLKDSITTGFDHAGDNTNAHGDYIDSASVHDSLDIVRDEIRDTVEAVLGFEWIELRTVHGADNIPNDSLYLSFPKHTATEAWLFRDSAGTIDACYDTVLVTGSVPYDFAMDSLIFTFKESTGSGQIDSIAFMSMAIDATSYTLEYNSNTERTGASWTTIRINTAESLEAGDKIALALIFYYAAADDNDWFDVMSVFIGGNRE